MKKTVQRIAAFLTGMFVLYSGAGAAGYETYLENGEIPSLQKCYENRMDIGVSADGIASMETTATDRILLQCGLLICRKESHGKELLDRGSSVKKKDPEQARMKTGKAADVLKFAAEHGMKLRMATVIRADDTPDWFFHEKWSSTRNAANVSSEVMTARVRNAVRDQISRMNEQYPGVISEWEVVTGGRQAEDDPYLAIIGKDYVRTAFLTARDTADPEQKLLWALQDFPDAETLRSIRALREEGLLDGVSIECCLSLTETDWKKTEAGLHSLAETGAEIHLSGLEIGDADRTAAGQMHLAACYKRLFAAAESSGVKSISLKALQDTAEREKNTPPRLIDEKGRLRPAFFGALQDEDIPSAEDADLILDAVNKLNLEEIIRKESDPVIVYKKAEDHNPVMVQRFGADPWAMVYRDRVYLYMTGDEPAVKKGETPRTNDYSNINTLRVVSSDDLVNWTDHGSVLATGANGAAKWARNAWAPSAAWKTIDGKDQFFLYFANSGGGIGVLTADSPVGPFTDPLGHALVSRDTPTCADVTWLFDPAVLIDDDGSAYLYFGGGIPEGRQADPGTARVVKLSDDMIHLDGDPVPIHPPYLFEDSGINRFGETYVYSYCTNFSVPSSGSEQGFGGGEIVYMTSDSPTGPFIYGGQVLRNPGFFFGTGGNNHHAMFEFRGEWYITYHAATLDKAMGWNAGYRSVFVDKLELTENGLPAPSKGTYRGVRQIKALDPFTAVPGATAVTMAGTTTVLADEKDKKYGTGRMAVLSTTPDSWVAVFGADFGADGACSVRAAVRSEVPAKIEILTDIENAEPIAILDIPACETDREVTAELNDTLKGMHNLYFRFTDSGVSLLEWQFQQKKQ